MTIGLDVYTDTWGIPQFKNRGCPVLNIPNRFQLKFWMHHARPGERVIRNAFSDGGFALEEPDDV
jgi:hypothetical protein